MGFYINLYIESKFLIIAYCFWAIGQKMAKT